MDVLLYEGIGCDAIERADVTTQENAFFHTKDYSNYGNGPFIKWDGNIVIGSLEDLHG